MNKKLLFVLGAIIIIGGVVFYNKTEEQSPTVKVGIMMPLSGDFGALGESIGKASLLAIKDYRALHPEVAVTIVQEDDKFDVKTGITAYTKMTSLDKVDGIVMVSTPVLDAAHEKMQTDGLPIMSVGLQNEGVANDNIFQLTPDPNMAIKDFATYINTNGSHQKIAIVHANTAPALIGFYDTFKKTYTKDSVDFMLNTSDDAKVIASKIAASKVDGIVIMTMPGTGAMLTKELLQLGVTPAKVKFYYDAQLGTGWSEYVKQVGDMKKLDGSVVLQFSVSDLTSFKESYKKEYGVDPSVYSEYGYDGTMALLNAYQSDRQGGLDKISQSDFKGYSGRMKFDERGVRLQESEIWTISNGATVKI